MAVGDNGSMFDVVEMGPYTEKGTGWPSFCGDVFAGRPSERSQATACWLLKVDGGRLMLGGSVAL
jgi:hypothetical protein